MPPAPGRRTQSPALTEVMLRWRCSSIKKLGNGGYKLRRREWLRQHDAIRDTLRRPITSISAAHVNDRKGRVYFSGMSGDVPAVDLDSPKIDVGHKRSIFSFGCVEQLQSIFAGRSYYYLKSAVGKAFFDDALNKLIVLNDQNNWLFFHPTLPGRAAQKPP